MLYEWKVKLPRLMDALPPAADAPAHGGEAEDLASFDAGLLNDFGGGDVAWWQDYIRCLLNEAEAHYQAQHTAELDALRERVAELEDQVAAKDAECARLNKLLDEVLTNPSYEGGVQSWIQKHDKLMLQLVEAVADLAAVTAHNRALREALEFYASRETYVPDAVEAAGASVSIPGTEPIGGDLGDRARAALSLTPSAALAKRDAEVAEKAYILGAESVDERVTYDYAHMRWMQSNLRADLLSGESI